MTDSVVSLNGGAAHVLADFLVDEARRDEE